MIQDIQAVQDEMESDSVALVEQITGMAEENENDDNLLSSIMETALLDNADRVVQALWKLQDQLLFKYASGFVNELKPDGMSQMKGYPAWWLQAVGYPDGPPPPPTEPKCCHPIPKNRNNNNDDDDDEATDSSLTGKAAMRQFLRVEPVAKE